MIGGVGSGTTLGSANCSSSTQTGFAQASNVYHPQQDTSPIGASLSSSVKRDEYSNQLTGLL